MGNILQDMMGLLSRKKVAKKADPNNYIILGRIQGPEGIYAYDPKMENRLITFEEFKSSLNTGTTNFIPLWSDGPKGSLADSQLQQSPQLSSGLYQMRVNNCDRFIINKPASVTSGDPEYLIQQDGDFKVSLGWDDDGGGFGFIYNWAGLGLKFGAAGNNPMIEIKTTSGAEEIDLHKSVKFVDYGSGSKTGTPTFNLSVNSTGNIIETNPIQYSPASGTFMQGANPATTQVGVTAFGIGAGASLGPSGGGVPGDSGNTAFGFNALNLENNEVQCTAVGYKALAKQNVSAMFAVPSNTAIGFEAGMECTLSLADTFVGAEIKSVNPGQSTNNVGVGRSCLKNMQDGFANVALGAYALEGLISANQNIAIGWKANDGATTGNNNIVIGDQAEPSTLAISNEITLGNSSTAALRCQVTSITALSDKRDKKDIKDSVYGLDFVDNLKPVTFEWDRRDGAKKGLKDVGFVAQDLQEVDDEYTRLVYETNPEKLEATYGRLIPVLVKAIQDLSAKVKALENS